MEPEKEIVSYLRKYGNTKENDLVDFGIKKLGFSSEEMKRTLTCLVVKGRIHRIVHNRLEPPVSYVSLTESLPPENIENFMEAGVPEDMTKEAMSMPNRTVIVAGNEPSEGQMDTLLKALRQKLKEELLEKPIAASKTV